LFSPIAEPKPSPPCAGDTVMQCMVLVAYMVRPSGLKFSSNLPRQRPGFFPTRIRLIHNMGEIKRSGPPSSKPRAELKSMRTARNLAPCAFAARPGDYLNERPPFLMRRSGHCSCPATLLVQPVLYGHTSETNVASDPEVRYIALFY
jgi:hypothetical protein